MSLYWAYMYDIYNDVCLRSNFESNSCTTRTQRWSTLGNVFVLERKKPELRAVFFQIKIGFRQSIWTLVVDTVVYFYHVYGYSDFNEYYVWTSDVLLIAYHAVRNNYTVERVWNDRAGYVSSSLNCSVLYT